MAQTVFDVGRDEGPFRAFSEQRKDPGFDGSPTEADTQWDSSSRTLSPK